MALGYKNKKVYSSRKIKQKKMHIEAIKQMIALSSSGLGLVSALAWNNLIQEFVNDYIKKLLPQGSGIISLFLYALIVTSIAVFVAFQLSRMLDRLEKK